MPKTGLLDSPKQADSKLSSIGAPPKQPDTRGPFQKYGSTSPISSGPAVNLAARVESLAAPMQIRPPRKPSGTPETTTSSSPKFGQIEVKGFGRILPDLIEDESAGGKAGP